MTKITLKERQHILECIERSQLLPEERQLLRKLLTAYEEATRRNTELAWHLEELSSERTDGTPPLPAV